MAAKRVQLPNQWKLTPAGYTQLPLGDLPLQIVLSENHRRLAVTNNGVAGQKIQLFGISGKKISLLNLNCRYST